MAEIYAIGVSFSVRIVEVHNGYIFLAVLKVGLFGTLKGDWSRVGGGGIVDKMVVVDEEKVVMDDVVQEIVTEDTNLRFFISK